MQGGQHGQEADVHVADEGRLSVDGGFGEVAGMLTRDADGDMTIGKLKVSQQRLGHGSLGTIVYRGVLDGRPVCGLELTIMHHPPHRPSIMSISTNRTDHQPFTHQPTRLRLSVCCASTTRRPHARCRC